MVNLKKYGTATEVAAAVGRPRTTLVSAANRGEIEVGQTYGGTQLINVAAARKWSRKKNPSNRVKGSGTK